MHNPDGRPFVPSALAARAGVRGAVLGRVAGPGGRGRRACFRRLGGDAVATARPRAAPAPRAGARPAPLARGAVAGSAGTGPWPATARPGLQALGGPPALRGRRMLSG